MLLTHIAKELFIYSFVNMITMAMAALNLIMLLVVHDPPYYRFMLEKQINKSDFMLKKVDNFNCRSKNAVRNRFYNVQIIIYEYKTCSICIYFILYRISKNMKIM